MLCNHSVGWMLRQHPHDPRHSGGGQITAAPLGLIFRQRLPRYHGAQGAQRLLLDPCIRDASLRSSDVQGHHAMREICKDGEQLSLIGPLRQRGLQACSFCLGCGLHRSVHVVARASGHDDEGAT